VATRRRGRADKRRGPAWGKLITAVVLLAALAAAWRYTPLSELITAQRITAWARGVRDVPWAPIALVLAYTPAAVIMFPRPLLTLFTVLAFGPWLGFVYSMLGILTAALATYYTGRALPHEKVKRLAGDKLDDVSRKVRKHGFLAVLALRIAPVMPFTVDGIIAGALCIKLRDYMLGTVLGMLPGVLATTVFGNEIASAFEGRSEMNYWVIGGVAALLVLFTYFSGRWFAKQQSGS
jgi:phospholipase D1/2